jgi:hypothetical protein
VSLPGDSVHLDLVMAADAEIDRQLDAISSNSPVEVILWLKEESACPRGAFEARALQRGFTMQRVRASAQGAPPLYVTTFCRYPAKPE